MGKPSYLMDIGRRYVNLLVDRCLFQIVDRADMKYIKVHHVVRDMAILIGENEENCLFKTTQCLQKFPANEKVEHCKRIAVSFSNITTLPKNFNCSELLPLTLCRNKSLSEVPRDFFLNLHSLRVLDLSNTKIESLPSSMWDLGQLQFLKMSNTLIKDLRGVHNLSPLQFLHLDSCRELQELSSEIRGLQDLKHLNLDACLKLRRIPHGISELKSLVKLQMITGASAVLNVTDLVVVGAQNENACSFEGLKSFRNLMELSVLVYPGNVKEEVFEDKIINGLRVKTKLLRMYGIEVGTMGTWTELRTFTSLKNWKS